VSGTAVVLFNLGGPDRLEAVRPFLFNLFRDKAIIGLPLPLRLMVAWLIAKRREAVARDIYARLGGGSPLLAETQSQARALEAVLGPGYRVFIAMRYWHPLTEECAVEVAAAKPEKIVLLPLYPQRSTTTTDSSFAAWSRTRRRYGITAPERAIDSYPALPGLVEAQADLIAPMLDEAGPNVRLLFSAHGLPKRIVAKGDEYPDQVMITARAVAEKLARPGLDWLVCYQSRVGPLEWIGPYTDDEIRRAGREGRALVVVPIAFVSEHSETLVELDMDYRRLAEESGVKTYIRVPAVGTHPDFIAGLAELVRGTATGS
jgi:ferrochelatase